MINVSSHLPNTSLICRHVFSVELCGSCNHVLPSGMRKCCGSCKITRYCSKTCQKSDWKAGHREACYHGDQFKLKMSLHPKKDQTPAGFPDWSQTRILKAFDGLLSKYPSLLRGFIFNHINIKLLQPQSPTSYNREAWSTIFCRWMVVYRFTMENNPPSYPDYLALRLCQTYLADRPASFGLVEGGQVTIGFVLADKIIKEDGSTAYEDCSALNLCLRLLTLPDEAVYAFCTSGYDTALAPYAFLSLEMEMKRKRMEVV